MDHQPALNQPKLSQPLQYLVIGHVTADLTENGVRLGGTSAFSGLTANALGLRSGMVTSFAKDLDISPIDAVWIMNKASQVSTTFKNISDGVERTQFLFHTAKRLTKKDLPTLTRPPGILHLGPVANEVDPDILSEYPNSMKCLTPQGWFRGTTETGKVERQVWENCEQFLSQADIAVISQEDVQNDENYIAKMADSIPVFVVTENFKGARVYWHNDARYFNAPEVKYKDDTGAGDIFATAFFYRYYFTRDPWEAGRFAVLLASWSVTRQYLDSIPTPGEIQKAKLELIEH